jgi:hypothetical protein
MSIGYRVSITDNATPAVQGLVNRITEGNGIRGGALEAMGARVAMEMQRNFEALPPNRMFPGRTTNFWKAASRATSHQVEGLGVVVSVNKIGVRQRFYGGTITPQKGKYLTIPARAEAYGKSAREFDNLKFIKFANGTAALVEKEAIQVKWGRKKKDGTRNIKSVRETGGGIMYWLKESVTQVADPTVLPSDEKLTEAAVEGLREYFSEG